MCGIIGSFSRSLFIGSFSRSLFVVVAVVYNHIKFEKSQTRLVSHSKTHSKAFFVPREVVVMW